jgi:hypothetical protein
VHVVYKILVIGVSVDGFEVTFTTPKVSSIAFRIGVIALVVHDAAEKILTLVGVVLIVVDAMNDIWDAFPGAVSKTLSTPLELSGVPVLLVW